MVILNRTPWVSVKRNRAMLRLVPFAVSEIFGDIRHGDQENRQAHDIDEGHLPVKHTREYHGDHAAQNHPHNQNVKSHTVPLNKLSTWSPYRFVPILKKDGIQPDAFLPKKELYSRSKGRSISSCLEWVHIRHECRCVIKENSPCNFILEMDKTIC